MNLAYLNILYKDQQLQWRYLMPGTVQTQTVCEVHCVKSKCLKAFSPAEEF